MEDASELRPARMAALIEPRHLARALRVAPGAIARRMEWRLGGSRRSRRGILLEVSAEDARSLRHDPLLAGALLGEASVVPGPTGGPEVHLEMRNPFSGKARGLDGRILGELETWSPPAGGPVPIAPIPGGRERIAIPISSVSSVSSTGTASRGASPETLPQPDALWVPARLVHRFLTMLARGRPAAWSAVRIHAGEDGIVAAGAVPARRVLAASGLALAVPLRSRTPGEGSTLFVESRRLPAIIDEVLPPRGAAVIRIEDGRARVTPLESPGREAADLLRARSRRLRFLPPSSPARKAMESAAEPDLRSRASAVEIVTSIRPREVDPRLRKTIEDAIPRPEGGGSKHTAGSRAPSEPGGRWLRRFFPWKLPEALRRRLDRRGRARVGDPRERARVIARQRDALALLLEGLAGTEWRRALPAALPLRAPGEMEPGSAWLHAGEPGMEEATEFRLEAAARKASFGIIGVGPRLYAQLEALYRRAGEALLASGEHRRAAHVYSFLLGDHERAAAVLEQGGLPREAATVYYHLAAHPRKAAVALERGGLHEEAARIWMDLGRWGPAARAWSRAGNEEQASAAWRRVAIELRREGRFIEAALVLERELQDADAARSLLERCVLEMGPSSLDALEKLLEACLSDGEDARASGIFERAGRAFRDASAGAPRRAPLKLLLELSARASRWSGAEPFRRVVDAGRVRAAWIEAARAWARARPRSPRAVREELDPLLTAASEAAGAATRDPWLSADAARWLRAPFLQGKSPGRRLPVREAAAGSLTASFFVGGGRLLAGTEEGRVHVLDREGRETARLETGSSRPVTALEGSRSDVYSAADEEVHHFDLDGAGPSQPVQIERTLPGRVQSLLLFPDAGLIRVTTREARILHPAHLGSLGILHDAGGDSIAGACANRRHVAFLLGRGREGPGEWGDEPRFEVIVFRRRSRAGRLDLRPVESIPAGAGPCRRIHFMGPEEDDLLLVGDDRITVLPSRREDVLSFELEASSRGARMPPARAAATPRRDGILVAYGDGSLELISLPCRERAILVEEPGGDDPLTGFACEAATGPGRRHGEWTAWLLHRSGRLRRAEGGGEA